MDGKMFPAKWAKVPFDYCFDNLMPKAVWKMTILTGFVGMSVDSQGFIRPQIGWSIHSHDSSPEGKKKIAQCKKEKRQYYTSKYIDHITKNDETNFIELAQLSGNSIDFLLKGNAKKVKFAETDAS